LKPILGTLLIVIVVGPATSAVQAQWPGAGDPGHGRFVFPPARGVGADGQTPMPPGGFLPPPMFQGFRDQEKRRDDHGPLSHLHMFAHGMPHERACYNGPNTGRAPGVDPHVVARQAGVPASELRVGAFPEWKFTPPPVRPVMTEGGGAIARFFSRARGGGILAGIGGGLAAVFGALFGRKKDSTEPARRFVQLGKDGRGGVMQVGKEYPWQK
jgi:hypothetical protein